MAKRKKKVFHDLQQLTPNIRNWDSQRSGEFDRPVAETAQPQSATRS
jgi:hypothetical protein